MDSKQRSFLRVSGAIGGFIAATAVAAVAVMTGGLPGMLVGAVLITSLVAVCYAAAGKTAGLASGGFMRGFLIGLDTGVNTVLSGVIFGPIAGIITGIVNVLAAFDFFTRSRLYQAVLGWSSWFMPMSWPATGLGLVCFLLNLIPAMFAANRSVRIKIHRLTLDRGTGTIVMEGGWTFLPGFRGGFSLGNFAFVTMDSGVTDHETGHTLNVAAFGSIFHFIGAIDQNIIRSVPENAYAERCADSHVPNAAAYRLAAGHEPVIPLWA
ncbi:MAG: hypothetical protein HGA62_05170 [Chlorobiaceae bacterium]|nr:hypothetical protein [Chlorobiaceae bacterium]NTV61533.1 hypothetical protein [Chlorobiaceae bacterium]